MRRRVRLLLLACFQVSTLLLLTGCPKAPRTVVIDGREVPYEEAARAAFANAEEAYQKKDFPTAIERYQAFRRDFPRSSLVDDAIFRLGRIHEIQGDVPAAARAYEKLIADYGSSDLAGEARYRLGLARFRGARWSDAESLLREYVRRAKDERRLAHGRLLIAEALERQDKATEAAPWRLLAARGLEDPVLAAWSRKTGLEALRKQPDAGVLRKLVQELAGDPALPRLKLLLAEAHYADRDYAEAARIARELETEAAGTLVGDDARALLSRADAREKVDARAIGVVMPLSGDFQAYGAKALQAVLLAANVFGPETAGGPKVRIAVRDSAGDPARAAQAVEELFAEEGIVGIVGPLLSNETEAAAPRAQALGVPMVTLAQKKGLTDAGRYVFRNSMTASVQAKEIARHAFDQLGVKRFAIMYPDNAYGQELAFLFWDEVVARGGEVVGVEHYDPKENDFTDEVERLVGSHDSFIPARREEWDRIKAAAKAEEKRTGKKARDLHLPPIVDFDAIFVPDDYKRVGQLLPFFALADVPIGGYTARNPNVRPVVPLGTSGWNNPELISRGGRYVAGARFVDAFYPESPRPEVRRFVEQFVGVFLRVPDILDALAYDTTAVMIDRMRSGTRGRDDLREELDDLKGYSGVTGLTGFGKDRDARRELTVLTVTDNEIRPLDVAARTP